MKTARKIPTPLISRALMALEQQPATRRITMFMSPKLTAKVTRQRKVRANARQETFLLSVGTPNFLERRLLKSGKVSKFPTVKSEAFAN